MVIIPLINLIGVIRLKNKLPPKYYVAFLIYLLPLIITFFAHIFFYSDMLVFIGVVLSTLSMFVIRMRPHFICNAMMSIYYLCAKDSKNAQQVTLDFTTYLRKNFTAIVSENNISFSDELERYAA